MQTLKKTDLLASGCLYRTWEHSSYRNGETYTIRYYGYAECVACKGNGYIYTSSVYARWGSGQGIYSQCSACRTQHFHWLYTNNRIRYFVQHVGKRSTRVNVQAREVLPDGSVGIAIESATLGTIEKAHSWLQERLGPNLRSYWLF